MAVSTTRALSIIHVVFLGMVSDADVIYGAAPDEFLASPVGPIRESQEVSEARYLRDAIAVIDERAGEPDLVAVLVHLPRIDSRVTKVDALGVADRVRGSPFVEISMEGADRCAESALVNLEHSVCPDVGTRKNSAEKHTSEIPFGAQVLAFCPMRGRRTTIG